MNYEQMGKNLKKIVDASELFTTLMYFLHEVRDYKDLNIKIGTFEYEDGWTADINCILKSDNGLCDVYFTETRYDLGKTPVTSHIELINLSYGWGFDESIIKFDFNIIKDFKAMLDAYESDLFWEMYHDIHAEFW